MTKILLVEDDKSLREIYGVRLLAEGYDILSAGDGEEALAMAIKDRPALIVSDVMMPKISGFDMLDILRSTTETRDIKVIMMTALSSEDQRKRGESLGADRYLVKSQVGIEDVVRAVHEVLGDAPGSAASTPQPVPVVAPVAPTPIAPAPMPAPAAEPIRPEPQAAPALAIPARDDAAPTPPAPAPAAVPPAPAPPVAAAPAAEPASLPQPTAPFSTARPASLGDRVIQPLSNLNDTSNDVADRMAEELSTTPEEPVSSPAAAPAPAAVPPAPAPPVAAAPAAPTYVGPLNGNMPPATATPTEPSTPEIEFEETPRATPSAPTTSTL